MAAWGLIVLLQMIAFSEVFGDKKWIKNTNFHNKDNWRRGELPCASDRIELPRKSPVISVMKNLYISYMMLPSDGELVLNEGVSLFAVPPEQMHTGSCHGKDVKFTRVKALSWFDPGNWCSMKSDGRCVQSHLHASVVPSQFDNALFPNPKDSYYVDVDYDDTVTIRGLDYRHKWQTTHGFRIFVSSPEGRREFINSKGHFVPTITMTKTGCNDKSGCIPNTLKTKLLAKICSKVSCPKAKCKSPLNLTGACCGWCGSQVLVTTSDTFFYSSFESQICSTASSKQVQCDVIKLSPKSVQVALSDEEGGKKAAMAAKDIKNTLSSEKKSLGVVSYLIKSSYGSSYSSFQSGKRANASLILGILFGILFLVVIVFIAYEVNRRIRNGQLTLPHIQNIFVNTSSANMFRFSWTRWQESPEGSARDRVNVEMRSPVASFNNPVYRGSSDINVSTMDDVYDDPVAHIIEDSLTNPVYRSESPLSSTAEVKRPVSEPGTLIISRGKKMEIINKGYIRDKEEDSTDA